MELAMRQINSLDSLKGLQGPFRDARTQSFLDTLKFDGLDLIVVEWLLLQNPTQTFRAGAQPLPGQSYPGKCCACCTAGLLEHNVRAASVCAACI
jgi:hypothetical protein